MSHIKINPAAHVETTSSNWKGFYKTGAVAALIAVLAIVLDMIISFRGEDFSPGALNAVEWFHLYQSNGLSGLRGLGLINVVNLTITIPLYFALYTAHRKDYPASSVLVLILFLLGTAVYISNNAAIPMYVLSGKYMAAAAESQKAIFAAAGEAALARGADFTPGSFVGFMLTEIAGLGYCMIMLRSRIFGRAAAMTGLIGFALLSIFTVWTTFIPAGFEIGMLIAAIGGFSSTAWYILTAMKLFQLGRSSQGDAVGSTLAIKGV